MVDNEEYTVLIVDDEEMVTTSISTLFMLETDYDVLIFNSPNEALEQLRTQEADLIISDYLMPGEMNGVQFLLKMKELQPAATRILLTAYADKENAIKAINDVGLFQYIEKPWDNNDLLIVLRNGLERQMLMKQLEEKIGEINKAYADLQGLQREIVKTFV